MASALSLPKLAQRFGDARWAETERIEWNEIDPAHAGPEG